MIGLDYRIFFNFFPIRVPDRQCLLIAVPLQFPLPKWWYRLGGRIRRDIVQRTFLGTRSRIKNHYLHKRNSKVLQRRTRSYTKEIRYLNRKKWFGFRKPSCPS